MEVFLIFLPLLVMLALYIWMITWVYQDATKRGLKAGLWSLIVLFMNVPGLLLYLVLRDNN